MQFSTKIKLKNAIMAVLVSGAAIIIPAYLFDKWVEAIFFFFCHWFIREQFQYQYHCSTHAKCRVVTAIVFVVGMVLIVPIKFSLFSTVYLCYFIGYIGYMKKKLDKAEAKIDRLTAPKLFDCLTCTQSELLKRCEEIHLSEDNTKLAVQFFILKTKQSVIADELCINEKSVQIRKKRLKEKLNTVII